MRAGSQEYDEVVSVALSRRALRFLILAATCALAACGGGSSSAPATSPTQAPSSIPTAVPIATSAPFAVQSVVTPIAAATAVPLPADGNYSGAITFGAVTSTIAPGTTISITLTNITPSTPNAPTLSDVLRQLAGRRSIASSGAIDVLEYIDVLCSNSVTYATTPGFSLTVPAAEIATASYYLAIYDPTRPSLGWQLGFEGPATITGSTLTFTGASTPFTFAADTNYYFAAYAISTAAATPTPAPFIAPIIPTAAPSATPTPVLTPTPTPTPTIAPTATPTTAPTPTPTPGQLTAPTSVSIGVTNPVSTTIPVSEADYTGAFTETNDCSEVATIGSASSTGPSASVLVTQLAAGTCKVTIMDDHGGSMSVSVNSTTFSVTIKGKRRVP
jgi:hypothetical protein